jgi:glycosyltransferase involved in cell wall biosynthesis
MKSKKVVGVNALFLRKPGTGIGQVTGQFLESLEESLPSGTEARVYTDVPTDAFFGKRVEAVYLRPWWQRDDLVRKMLWEGIQLPWQIKKDSVTHFVSLYQSPTVLPKKITHVMVVHDLIPELFLVYRSRLRSSLAWKITKRGIQKASRLVAVSQSTKNDTVRFLGRIEKEVTVVYPSIARIFFQDRKPQDNARLLEKYKLTPGYLYHGGGLEIRKNTQDVLTSYAAWKHVQGMLPPLVISGVLHNEKNTLATQVRKIVRDLKIEQDVHLLGFVPEEDLPALYRGASLFLFPSLYEGFGMPVVEALSQGTAVLTLQNSSLPEVGGMGIYSVPTLTKESLQEAYQKATLSSLHERETRKRIAEKFKQRKQFTKEVLGLLLQ